MVWQKKGKHDKRLTKWGQTERNTSDSMNVCSVFFVQVGQILHKDT